MVATAYIPRLSVVGHALRERRRPSLAAVLGMLEAQRRRGQAAVILNELDPKAFRKAARGEKEDKYQFAEDPLIDACLRAIDKVAPLDLDQMGMRCEEETADELYPSACGYPMGWDEWEELVEDVNTAAPEISLYLFVTAMRLGDGAVLFKASEHFGWDLENLEEIPDPNWERLFGLLEEHGLGCFKNAIEACLYDTGNVYFDYNPWDEETIPTLPPFTLAGVRALEEEWAEAQPIRKDLDHAARIFAQDLSLARKLMDLYAASACEHAYRLSTLAEMWAGEGEDEPVIDEFYGQIG